MIFAQFPCDEAEGIYLAHTLRLPGRALKKGTVLDANAIAALRQAGIHSVAGARLQAGDIGENEAAHAVAEAIAGPHIEYHKPFTGRCNLHADVSGVAVLERKLLERLNMLNEAITVATLPPFSVVRPGNIVATVKIIPFAVTGKLMEMCREIAAEMPLIRVAALQPHRCGLIMSELPGTKASVLDSTAIATRGRLEPLGSTLALELRCPHAAGAVENALRRVLVAGCDLVLISGATVSKDRGDVIPEAIQRAGGIIDHFGMPVEPGNMLLLAHVGGVPVINLPGCSRSPKLNGLDWILQRLLAKLPVTGRDIMLMGVGGLIKSSPEAYAGRDDESASPSADEAAIAGSES